jgi:ATP-binding protein involved in chromosome partitioning
VRRGIGMFRSVNVPILGIVENMSYFSCPDCGIAYDIFGSGGGQQLADDYHLPLLGKIPIDPLFREGGDAGKPAVENPACAARWLFCDLAERVDAMVAKQPLVLKEQSLKRSAT